MTPPSRLRRDQVPPVYAVVDADVVGGRDVPDAVAAIVGQGVSWIQLRAKQLGDRELCELVERCLPAVSAAGADLWVNDRPDLAAIYPVQGVHLGQEDLSPTAARPVVGEGCWIGQSTHNLSQIEAAATDPAVDVLAVGPIFATLGKKDSDPVVGLELLVAARAATEKPIVGIGGIDVSNVLEVLSAGADTAAMIGAVCRGDVEANCRRLQRAVAAAPGEAVC